MKSEFAKRFARVRFPGKENALYFEEVHDKLISSDGWEFTAYPFDQYPDELNGIWPTQQEDHLRIVNQAIDAIQSGKLTKVVISRVKEIPLKPSVEDSIDRIFSALCEKYPLACVYVYRMNVHSVWIGATPEVLVSKQGNVFSTMALAGTRLAQEAQNEWGEKEKNEQAVVTNFMDLRIQQNGGTDIQLKGPYTSKAAHLEHIRTDIQFASEKTISDWIRVFHPTPAICGMPVDAAKGFIQSHEKHQRRMYSGYFLVENNQGEAMAYVQLRCMEIAGNKAFIYVGGGIMGDSDASAEWIETENKAMVMQRVLEDLNLS